MSTFTTILSRIDNNRTDDFEQLLKRLFGEKNLSGQICASMFLHIASKIFSRKLSCNLIKKLIDESVSKLTNYDYCYGAAIVHVVEHWNEHSEDYVKKVFKTHITTCKQNSINWSYERVIEQSCVCEVSCATEIAYKHITNEQSQSDVCIHWMNIYQNI